jgi:hypothetical protein
MSVEIERYNKATFLRYLIDHKLKAIIVHEHDQTKPENKYLRYMYIGGEKQTLDKIKKFGKCIPFRSITNLYDDILNVILIEEIR